MFADRMKSMKPFLVFDVFERAKRMERAGEHVIHMEVGEPDFDTPQCVCESAKIAIGQGHTHYTPSLGDVDLREAVAEHYHTRYNVQVSPDNVLIFPGTSPALMLLFCALLNPGDEVIVPNPCYACYGTAISFAGGVVRDLKTEESEGFQYRPEEISAAIGVRTKAIMLNSPSNPTGIVFEPERIKRMAELGTLIVSDEIYHGLTYDDAPEHSVLEYTDNAVVIGGFSKLYAMTGWRLGYMIAPTPLVRPIQLLMQNFIVCANAFVQRAGITALRHAAEDAARMRDIYNERRKMILAGLKDLGFRIPVEPKGAFYVLVNARHLGQDSLKLAFDILEKAKVGVAPGIDFGSQAEGFLRFSYASSFENIQEAMRRMRNYIEHREK
jgi:aspartate/methionine/tyrosine aminotransferase